jgi:uncharacterized protein
MARREEEPLLPLWPGEVSNGEFIPRAPTARDRYVAGLALERANRAADRAGIDRRRFLQSAGGVAAVLATFNLACSADSPSAGPTSTRRRPTSSTATSAPSATSAPGGTFTVPDPEDVPACEAALGDQGEFIFDVHTHHVVPDGPWRQSAPAIADMILPLAPAACTEADPFSCLDRLAYVQDLLVASDTTVALLSDVPNSGPADAPLPYDEKVATQEFAASLAEGGPPRVLVHDVLAPNFGDLSAHLDAMEERVESGRVAAFKVYTAWGPGGQGYSLLDPELGVPVVQKARELGVNVFCGHKGLPIVGFDQRFNGPDDLVASAAQNPDMQFVVFHSAFERETHEGPYDPASADRGVDSLLRAMDDHGLPPNSNVWAELGTTWREVLTDPDQSAHVLGKLLSRIGTDRVLWGTDAIWYGSPQPQIMAFRSFEITEAYQEQFGYPSLTPEVKRRVLGLNAADLFGLDPQEVRCAIDQSKLEAARTQFRQAHAAGEIVAPWRPRGPVTRRQMLAWLQAAPFSPL